MELKLSIQLNPNLYLRDPESSDLGRRIVRVGIDLMYRMGLESFTFKKLAEEIKTTEASIYRYFENKHRLLQYIVAWYWNYLEYLVLFKINNLTDTSEKIHKIIDLLVGDLDESLTKFDFDSQALYNIVISESAKAYLSKDVDDNNSVQLYKPYKDLCSRIAAVIIEHNAAYPYPHSLSSTLVETAHTQHFFMQHLPRLTDFGTTKDEQQIKMYLTHLVFSSIDKQ